jgi:hypothetical protein
MFLDLNELPDLFSCHPFWSSRRLNLAFFRRRDHLGDSRRPLDTCVRELVRDRTGARPDGPIRLLTHLRYFGYCFNPVSFYFCYDREDRRVETIVAEVHNTPWGEEHCYVLDDALDEHPHPFWKRFRFPKAFHVSPFMNMGMDYDWRFREPGADLNIHFTNLEGGERLFDATLTLRRREITGPTLSRLLLVYPFMTTKVIAAIHWQALRLLVKGAPVFTHPAKAAHGRESKTP